MESRCQLPVEDDQNTETCPDVDDCHATESDFAPMLGLNILELPDSILFHILIYLPFNSIGTLAQVCQRFWRISLDELLWRHVFQRHYKLPANTAMPTKAKSWRQEFKRLYYHTPAVLSEERKEHKDEVLHVSFSHDGTMFATCSKDGFFKVWECTHPVRLLFKMDMKSTFSWKFTQFSQFNETDSCLLVSGIYFGRISTSGEIAVFSLQDDFSLQCRVPNKPYDVVGAWYDNDHLLSGNLQWTGDFNSVSSVWLSKAYQEVDSEKQSVSMVLYRFENVNSSSIRLLHIAEIDKDSESTESIMDKDELEATGSSRTSPSSQVSLMDDGKAGQDLETPRSRSASRGQVPRPVELPGRQPSMLDHLLERCIAEDEFDLENEDKTDDDDDGKISEDYFPFETAPIQTMNPGNVSELNILNGAGGAGDVKDKHNQDDTTAQQLELNPEPLLIPSIPHGVLDSVDGISITRETDRNGITLADPSRTTSANSRIEDQALNGSWLCNQLPTVNPAEEFSGLNSVLEQDSVHYIPPCSSFKTLPTNCNISLCPVVHPSNSGFQLQSNLNSGLGPTPTQTSASVVPPEPTRCPSMLTSATVQTPRIFNTCAKKLPNATNCSSSQHAKSKISCSDFTSNQPSQLRLLEYLSEDVKQMPESKSNIRNQDKFAAAAFDLNVDLDPESAMEVIEDSGEKEDSFAGSGEKMDVAVADFTQTTSVCPPIVSSPSHKLYQSSSQAAVSSLPLNVSGAAWRQTVSASDVSALSGDQNPAQNVSRQCGLAWGSRARSQSPPHVPSSMFSNNNLAMFIPGVTHIYGSRNSDIGAASNSNNSGSFYDAASSNHHLIPDLESEALNMEVPIRDVGVGQRSSIATQTELPTSRASSFHSLSHISLSSSLSQDFRLNPPKDKLLIYTYGSETYIPHKVGIKRMRLTDFTKGEVTARRSSMLLPDVMENLHSMSGNRRDKPDVSIEMHGHIVGLSLSPDHKFLYVNCRPWPKNYIISDPQESPPLAQEVEISTIDLTTFNFVGPVLRSHKAYTHSDECFFLSLGVSDDYVASGAEDRQGYLWDRHYGIPLYRFPHRNVVNCVAINPQDSEILVTVSDDHTFKVWMSRCRAAELTSSADDTKEMAVA